jgi:VIT1/CCC1 family predicted Fe2+/Mn2+ transporter
LQRSKLYIKDMVYGANDGIVTTFAVVAGVTGGGLSPNVVLTIGVASLLADGFSMAASDYLGSRSEEATQKSEGIDCNPERNASLGAVLTFFAFLVSGTLPLLPYLFALRADRLFLYAASCTAIALVGVGVLRAMVSRRRLWVSTLEMLTIGGVAALLAYFVGYRIHALTQ